ncbi:hypothetical protein ID866_9340 [Astraeus odoratus]|nr:hypothetical protein ID866_9340 [Astraeus odoratus]
MVATLAIVPQCNPITQKRTLALLPTDDVRPLLGIEPYFGQGQYEGEAYPSDVPVLQAARLHGPRIVFLGLKEANPLTAAALPSAAFKDADTVIAKLEGTPFFSVDIADFDESVVNEVIQSSQPVNSPISLVFMEPKTAMTSLDVFTAAVFAEARSMVDWNGRNKKKFPPKFYSALAGFVEPGESYEDAVKREMWEEAGIRVWNIRYHSGQPWPFPANLMLGFYATADTSAPIRTDLDNELEDARWYTRQEVLAVLNHTSGLGSSEEAPLFKMPPPTAIAGVLIKQWAEGNIRIGYSTKGNL